MIAPSTRPAPMAMKNARKPSQNESVRFPVITAATMASAKVIGRRRAATVHRIGQLYAQSMDQSGTTRMEAFTDGVFAIAATLLILEITVDTSRTNDLGSALLHLWPSYLAYATSFITIGIIWMNHHTCIETVARVDRVFLFMNLLLLMIVAFLPFPTKLV